MTSDVICGASGPGQRPNEPQAALLIRKDSSPLRQTSEGLDERSIGTRAPKVQWDRNADNSPVPARNNPPDPIDNLNLSDGAEKESRKR